MEPRELKTEHQPSPKPADPQIESKPNNHDQEAARNEKAPVRYLAIEEWVDINHQYRK